MITALFAIKISVSVFFINIWLDLSLSLT